MKKPRSKPNNFPISLLVFFLAIFSFFASLYFSIKLQLNVTDTPVDTKYNNLDLLILPPLLIFGLISMIFMKHPKFNANLFCKIAIVLVATLGSLHSLIFIYYKMSDVTKGLISIDNNTNFTGLYFFAIYTLIYNGFLCEWWDKQKDSIKKYTLLCLIEIPNVIAWWILVFASPLSYAGGMNTSGHFWMTLFFALCVVLTLTGIRLYKKESAEEVSIQ